MNDQNLQGHGIELDAEESRASRWRTPPSSSNKGQHRARPIFGRAPRHLRRPSRPIPRFRMANFSMRRQLSVQMAMGLTDQELSMSQPHRSTCKTISRAYIAVKQRRLAANDLVTPGIDAKGESSLTCTGTTYKVEPPPPRPARLHAGLRQADTAASDSSRFPPAARGRRPTAAIDGLIFVPQDGARRTRKLGGCRTIATGARPDPRQRRRSPPASVKRIHSLRRRAKQDPRKRLEVRKM